MEDKSGIPPHVENHPASDNHPTRQNEPPTPTAPAATLDLAELSPESITVPAADLARLLKLNTSRRDLLRQIYDVLDLFIREINPESLSLSNPIALMSKVNTVRAIMKDNPQLKEVFSADFLAKIETASR